MGIAAGGMISQKIYQDSLSTDVYDEECVARLWIHAVSSEAWEVCLVVHGVIKMVITCHC